AQADFGEQTSFQFCIGNVGLEWSVIKDIEVYPNPFTNSIQINLNQIEATDIILTDIAGKEFLRKVVTGNKIQLELGSELSTGTYLIQIKMKDGSIITKKVNKI
ncbi:MAG: T9SS type A sorting domain-containing protein, partial [Crocinitomicaceae bacterium]